MVSGVLVAGAIGVGLHLLVAPAASGAVFEVDSTLDAVDAIPGDGVCASAVCIVSRYAPGHYTDAMVIYRGWKREIFTRLDLDRDESCRTEKLFATMMGIEPLLSVRAARRKLRICEIPGDEPARIGGVRKLQVIPWGGAYMAQGFLEEIYSR